MKHNKYSLYSAIFANIFLVGIPIYFLIRVHTIESVLFVALSMLLPIVSMIKYKMKICKELKEKNGME